MSIIDRHAVEKILIGRKTRIEKLAKRKHRAVISSNNIQRLVTVPRLTERSKINIIHCWWPFGIPIELKRMARRNSRVFVTCWRKAQVESVWLGERSSPSPSCSFFATGPSVNCEILHEQSGTPIAQVSPLIIACFEGDVDIIRFFIEVSHRAKFDRARSASSLVWRTVPIPIKPKVNIISLPSMFSAMPNITDKVYV